MDRIDIHLVVPCLKPEEFLGMGVGECSDATRQRVMAARDMQDRSLGNHRTNSKMGPARSGN